MSAAVENVGMEMFARTAFRFLRQMDREAKPLPDRRICGLYDYGRYARPELKKPQAEVEWSRRLAGHLRDAGWECANEVRYPNQPAGRRRRCDLVITVGDGDRLWVELKGGWKRYWSGRGNPGKFRSYLLGSTGDDISKLADLRLPSAQHIGLLLVGFDSADETMVDDVEHFEAVSGLTSTEWRCWSDEWRDTWSEDCTVRCWFWVRSV